MRSACAKDAALQATAAKPTAKLRLAAILMLFDLLVVG
jgi:hypothetical protein